MTKVQTNSILYNKIKHPLEIRIEHILKDENLEINFLHYSEPELCKLNLSILTKTEKELFESFKSTKRKFEFYFTRFLWLKFKANTQKQKIDYAFSGKPLITNGHISISHSQNTVAIGFCKNKTIGIDIEHYSEKIKRITPKFLSQKEQKTFDCKDLTTLTTMWSIKEAVYKLGLERGMSFRQQIQLKSIGKKNIAYIITKKFEGELDFYRILFNNFVLTYCTTDKIQSYFG